MTPLHTILEKVAGVQNAQKPAASAENRIVIVGSPNVGKSMMFNRLTGRYVTVSNYPGTTVEISCGRCRFLRGLEVIDTPGMYSLVPLSDEERVARDMLFEGRPRAVLHVIDAKNIQRMLGLTLQLAQARLPVVLVLNMFDEAQALGIQIDCAKLEKALGIPVVATVATRGDGFKELAHRIEQLAVPVATNIKYDPILESVVADVAARLEPRGAMPPRTRAELVLQSDAGEKQHLLDELGHDRATALFDESLHIACRLEHTPQFHLAMATRENVDALLARAVHFPPRGSLTLREKISQLCMNPWTGLPLLAAVLYFGLYQFVGKFGSGVCVDWIEHAIFEDHISPLAKQFVNWAIPWPILADLFVGEYGIFTLGLRYAVAIILPVVGTFFLAFSILEDSGYLPRLAMLIDRVFKKIGLNGRAVIPMVLGFGCDTMATLVTRTLETRRERVIATMLLALAIPCSAQMGLILALLSAKPYALLLWAAAVIGIFLLVGLLAAKLLPGERPSFYMELPPLRLPRLGNVMVKTYTRIAWYFKEILPMFIFASLLIWIGQVTGAFEMLVRAMKPVVGRLGLPQEAAVAFLFGFFRRDYGAAGLYDLQHQGLLSGNQLAVAAITLTLFLPCVAQFLIMKKERGLKATIWMSLFICAVAYSTGWIINAALNLLRVQL